MTDELREHLKAGAKRIRERDEWVDRMLTRPATAGIHDVVGLAMRVRALEKTLNDYYHHCTCSAGLEIALKFHREHDGLAEARGAGPTVPADVIAAAKSLRELHGHPVFPMMPAADRKVAGETKALYDFILSPSPTEPAGLPSPPESR